MIVKIKNENESKLSQEYLKKRNSDLERLNKKAWAMIHLKDEFLAYVSHDLRTPLNGIIGFAELMYDGKAGPVSSEHKEYLDEILSCAQLLLLLINDILDSAKINSGKMEFNPEKIELLHFMEGIKKTFNKLITEKCIKLDIQIDPLLKIKVDHSKFKRVIHNLVSNALKFTPNNGSVAIIVRSESDTTFRLEVTDTGVGIHEDDLQYLFSEFQQLKAGADKQYQGSGLGLALTKRIVEVQGGQIGVKSVVGKGSTFYVILPKITAKGMHGQMKQADPDLSKKAPHILIIEDSSKERCDLIHALKNKGYITTIADNMNDAIGNYRISDFDAIIIDFFISDIGKLQLLRAFRSRQSLQKAPALLITGVVSNIEAFGFKIHDFLLHPVNPHDLVEALKWSGANPYSDKIVLNLDDDKITLQYNNRILKKFGYQTICVTTIKKALSIVEKMRPDVLILNPFIESNNTNGFDFLHHLRLTNRGRYMPILITTLKILNNEERERIKGIIQRVVLKKENIVTSLIDEISKQIPI